MHYHAGCSSRDSSTECWPHAKLRGPGMASVSRYCLSAYVQGRVSCSSAARIAVRPPVKTCSLAHKQHSRCSHLQTGARCQLGAPREPSRSTGSRTQAASTSTQQETAPHAQPSAPAPPTSSQAATEVGHQLRSLLEGPPEPWLLVSSRLVHALLKPL